MNIEDCKTLPEFFGVEMGDDIWVQGEQFEVYHAGLTNPRSESIEHDSKALVGCLTGQLKWSKHEPMTAEEEKIIREIAVYFPEWEQLSLDEGGYIAAQVKHVTGKQYPFYRGGVSSKAYEVLAPILEKYGEINLDEYGESN